MLYDSVGRYREELKLASQRLYGLKEEFRELGVPSDTGKQILDRLDSENKWPRGEALGSRARG